MISLEESLKMNRKVSIIGCGSFASALANVLADNSYHPFLLSRDKNIAENINKNRINIKYFPSLLLNENVKASTDPSEVFADSKIIIISLPSKNIDALNIYLSHIEDNCLFINGTKGFDEKTGKGIHQKEKEILKDKNIRGLVSLHGPSFADEIIKRQYTCISAISEDEDLNREVQQMFSNDYFRVYTNNDISGCEVAAGMKNIIAIAAGILKGLGYENNSRAALITRGLNEIITYGLHFNASLKTFFSLACIGDLYMTCSSENSRNFTAGKIIGEKNSAVDFIKENKKNVEGIQACKIIYLTGQREKISLPITESIYRILFQGKRPSEELSLLMKRDLKKEM